MRKLRRILIVLLLVAVVAIFGASFYLAGLTAEPRGNTLDEEEAWERDHGLWEDFDQLPQESYTVQSVGADGNGAIGADAADEGSYTIHCTYIPAATKSDRYVIISHGFRANRYGAVKYVSSYRDLGFNCIIYDVRARRGHSYHLHTRPVREPRPPCPDRRCVHPLRQRHPPRPAW